MGYYDAMGEWHEESSDSAGTPRQDNTAPTFSNPVEDKARADTSTPIYTSLWNPVFEGDSLSAQINRNNREMDAGKPFVQAGDTGGYIEGIGVTIGPGRSTTPQQAQTAYDALVAKYGKATADSYLSRNPGDFTRGDEALSSEVAGQRDGGPGNNGAPAGRGPLQSPQFTGAGQNLIENYATDRFGQLTNPDPNSGTALFEQYARELINTLKGPAYSAQDESIIKGGALDSIERDRASTRQRWLEELSRRGIQPSSGIALQGLQNIDNQFNQFRTTVEAEFARKAIEQTRQQRFQVLNTAGQLAGSQEGRLDKAGTYAYMPYGLEQDAFNRNLALVGAGGSPQSTLSSALALLNSNLQQNAYTSQQRQALSSGLLEYLGFLLG